ncbi:hypothetical protein D7294_23800 [Streptomyces hoynatensis]|uniref:Uncharacterized protein n=1 Tax=Streptomyces hoynatensis TaxID=1141874 RepID=A0A3A9YSP3_9ACTN|nr:hypothetical protein D7294_23800 [Streptomyces hoynatensis]
MAESVVPGPAPVEQVMRRGRALRARRRLAVVSAATACVLAVALAVGLAEWPAGAGPEEAGGSGGTAPPAAQATPPGTPSPSAGGGLVEVRPYERVVINRETVLGLLPEGEQNYVITSPQYYAQQIEDAKRFPGNNVRPGSIGAGLLEDQNGARLIEGVWRLDETPARIMIEPEGEDTAYPATMVMLAGEPDWGVFYFDAARSPSLPPDFDVTAYDEHGRVLAVTQGPGSP